MYPVRIKEIHYYNYPKIFDAVFSIFQVFMKDKLKKRVRKSNLIEITNFVIEF